MVHAVNLRCLGRLVVDLSGEAAEESANGSPGLAVSQGSCGEPLTAREIEVLRYPALGWDIGNIAVEMGLSPHAMRNHSTNLRRKMDVGASLEAVMAALRPDAKPAVPTNGTAGVVVIRRHFHYSSGGWMSATPRFKKPGPAMQPGHRRLPFGTYLAVHRQDNGCR